MKPTRLQAEPERDVKEHAGAIRQLIGWVDDEVRAASVNDTIIHAKDITTSSHIVAKVTRLSRYPQGSEYGGRCGVFVLFTFSPAPGYRFKSAKFHLKFTGEDGKPNHRVVHHLPGEAQGLRETNAARGFTITFEPEGGGGPVQGKLGAL